MDSATSNYLNNVVVSDRDSLSIDAKSFWKDEQDYKTAALIKYLETKNTQEAKEILQSPEIKNYIDYRLNMEKIINNPDFTVAENIGLFINKLFSTPINLFIGNNTQGCKDFGPVLSTDCLCEYGYKINVGDGGDLYCSKIISYPILIIWLVVVLGIIFKKNIRDFFENK